MNVDATRTWTMRCARMLSRELQIIATERAAHSIDGSMTGMAMASILAVPAGPLRDFEIAKWAGRIIDGPGKIAFVLMPDASDEELDAFIALNDRILEELNAPHPAR